MDQFSFLFFLLAGAFGLTLVWTAGGLVCGLVREIRRRLGRHSAPRLSDAELRERFLQLRELRNRSRI